MKWQALVLHSTKPKEQNAGRQFWNNTEIKPALNAVMRLRVALIKLSIEIKIATKKLLKDKM